MLSKNIRIFLIITASYSLLIRLITEVYNYFAYDYYRDSLESILWFIVYLSMPIVWGIIGFSLQKETTNNKAIALALSILGGLSIVLLLISIYRLFFGENTTPNTSLIENLFKIGVSLFFFLGQLLLGIALYGNQLQRIKKACVWMLLGLTLAIISDCSNILVRIFGYGIGEVGSMQFVYEIASVLESLLYISMIVFVSNLYLSIHKNEKQEDNSLFSSSTIIPNPVNWLGNYSLASIPFIGTILILIWSFNDADKIRRNWAISTFLASIIVIALNLWFFTSVVGLFEWGSEVLFIGLMTLFLFIILGSVLIYRFNQQQPFEDLSEEEHENPSIQIWLANFLIVAIPLIGLICLIIWAVDNKNPIIRNWAIARLIWLGISIVATFYLYLSINEIQRIESYTFLEF